MPKTLADANVALVLLAAAPADPTKITVAEFDAGTRLECRVMDYRLSATGSDAIQQTELCNPTNASAPGRSNYEGNMTVFRYLTAAGLADSTNDVAWDAVKAKGTTLHLVEREGPAHAGDGEASEEVSYYEVITDDPQKPTDRTGYIRREIPLLVQRAHENTLLVTA